MEMWNLRYIDISHKDIGMCEGVGFEGLSGEIRIQLKGNRHTGLGWSQEEISTSLLPSTQYKYDTCFHPLFLLSCLPGSIPKDGHFSKSCD